jgi:hypothetical protein
MCPQYSLRLLLLPRKLVSCLDSKLVDHVRFVVYVEETVVLDKVGQPHNSNQRTNEKNSLCLSR